MIPKVSRCTVDMLNIVLIAQAVQLYEIITLLVRLLQQSWRPQVAP
jgi:hypothetical protein